MLPVEQVWMIWCSRCANTDTSDAEDAEQAHVELRMRGWTRGDRVYCPACSRETHWNRTHNTTG